MNEKDKAEIKKELKALEDEFKRSGEKPSKELLELIDEISQDLDSLEAKESKETTQTLLSKLDRLTKVALNTSLLSVQGTKTVIEAIKAIKVDPKITVEPPKVTVTVPKVEIPPIKLPTINVPQTKVNIPDEIKVKKPPWFNFPQIPSIEPILSLLKDIRITIAKLKLPKYPREAIPVRLVHDGRFYRAGGGSIGSGTTTVQPLPTDPNTNGKSVLYYNGAGNLVKIEKTIGNIVFTRDFSYDGSNNLTVMTEWQVLN